MNIHYTPFEKIPQLSHFDRSFANSDTSLIPFMAHPSAKLSLNKAKKEREDFESRRLLVDELNRQYQDLEKVEKKTIDLIQKLSSPNTFTVITAHQSCLMTGPFYFIHKALSVIKVAEKINQENTEFETIPVFILGGEDHDFEEVNHFQFNGKKFVWEDHQGGAIGRYENGSLGTLLDKYEAELGLTPYARELAEKMIPPFRKISSYGKAMQQVVHNLLGHLGLIVVQMDTLVFKRKAQRLFEDELLNNTSHTLVSETQNKLTALGFKPQAYVRNINLFYLSKNRRERIEKQDERFYLVESGQTFSRKEMLKEIENRPDCFSPNVVLRPLYQELIFPNLAYIGGGGELAYWMERKRQFEYYDIPFPVLIRRDSFLWIDAKMHKRMQKAKLDFDLIWSSIQDQIQYVIEQHSEHDLSLEKPSASILDQMTTIRKIAEDIDPTLGPYIGAETRKIEKMLGHYSTKLSRAEKKRHSHLTNHIKKLNAQLFPGQSLQERKINFSEFFLKHGNSLFDILLEQSNPFDVRFKILQEKA